MTELAPEAEKLLKGHRKKTSKHTSPFNLSRLSYQYFGTDLLAISGVSYNTVLCLLINMGHDIHKFPTAKSFACWLRLVPNNKISGGKVIGKRTPSGKNYIGKALRHAANSIGNQKNHELNPFFRRIAFKKGRLAAIIATARKLAVIVWNMIIKQEPYRKHQVETDQVKQKAFKLKQIDKKLQTLQLTKEELQRLFAKHSVSAT